MLKINKKLMWSLCIFDLRHAVRLDHFASSFSLTQWSWVTTRPVCYTLREHWTGQNCCRTTLPAKPSRRSTQTFLSCSLTLSLIPLTIHLACGLFYRPSHSSYSKMTEILNHTGLFLCMSQRTNMAVIVSLTKGVVTFTIVRLMFLGEIQSFQKDFMRSEILQDFPMQILHWV